MAAPLTARLANRAQRHSSAPLVDSERALIRRALLDTVGVGIAGWRLPSPRIVWSTLRLDSMSGSGRVLGLTARVAPTASALINGVLCHAQLYDDNNVPMIAHPSAPLVAVLLALGPEVGAGAPKLLQAYAVGFDISVLLGRIVNPGHYERGWHATATLGIFGATVTASCLLGCTAPELASALGIASSFASGIRQNFGSMTMGLHAGWAAQGAVTAALLARNGFSASPIAMDGKYGYLDAFGGGVKQDIDLETDLSELSRSGIQFKLFPCGAPTLCAVEAALEIAPQMETPIETVTCWVDAWSEKTLKEDAPIDPFSAKVNLRYCVAAALLKGRLTLDEFEPPTLHDPEVRALMARISVSVDHAFEDTGSFPARLVVRCGNRTICATRTYPLGSPQRPASDADLIAKFAGCLSRHMRVEDAAQHAQRILELEEEERETLFDTLAICQIADPTSQGLCP